MTIYTHQGDLPEGIDFGNSVAVDTETLGLNPLRDRLCVVQLSDGKGDAHLVQLSANDYSDAKNLKKVMSDPTVLKIFHFARFDVAVMKHYLNVDVAPVFCTKIASKLVRTYTDRHGLKDLTRELLGINMDKQQQSSDWAVIELSDEQKSYAASDVLYLHQMMDKLIDMLKRENRMDMAQSCFDFLPTRCALDLNGWDECDIFAHR
jgi:ribonuclease D